jgi:hypothetical protein
VKVVGIQKLIDNKDAYVWQYQNPWGKDTIYVRMENDTVKTFSSSYSWTIENLKFPRQMFLTPFQAGQKWNGKLYWIDTYGVSKDSIGYTINYHYVGPNMEYNDQLYFRPNIGFTKLDKSHYDLAPINHQIWQLEKYSLK